MSKIPSSMVSHYRRIWKSWRARAERAASQVDFAELLSVEKTRFETQSVARAAKPAQAADKPTKKQPGDTPRAHKPPGWIPKEEYLAMLEAGRAAQLKATKRKH